MTRLTFPCPTKERVPRSFRLEYPPGTPLFNVNSREHWTKRAKITKDLRELTRVLAKDIPPMGAIRVRATFFSPDNRRRDAPNVLYFSSKACIDGLVDCHVIVDDNDNYLKSLELCPGARKVPGGQLVIEVIEVDDARPGD